MDNSCFIEAAAACLDNGKRLLKDAEMVDFGVSPSTSLFLATIAQEEFAKGFLLLLLSREVIPWSSLIFRATRDHTCKQLLGIIMDHVRPDTDEFIRRIDERRTKNEQASRLLNELRESKTPEEKEKIWDKIDKINESLELLPSTVADAINIFRHEKIGRWESSSWFWGEEPNYDAVAKDVADGRVDREKQDAVYVRIDKDGNVKRRPHALAPEIAERARERAERMGRLVEDLLSGDAGLHLDYEKIESAFKAVFATLSPQTKTESEST